MTYELSEKKIHCPVVPLFGFQRRSAATNGMEEQMINQQKSFEVILVSKYFEVQTLMSKPLKNLWKGDDDQKFIIIELPCYFKICSSVSR
jgi:hypothetical protein